MPLLVPGTSRGTQTLLTTNQLLTASSMVWLRLRLETDSSCLYCNPSFICTVCTVYGAFLCALCFASEGPLGPVEPCFILVTSHDRTIMAVYKCPRLPTVSPFGFNDASGKKSIGATIRIGREIWCLRTWTQGIDMDSWYRHGLMV